VDLARKAAVDASRKEVGVVAAGIRERAANLVDPRKAVVAEAGDRVVRVGEGVAVARVEDAGAQRGEAVQRGQVVGDASRVFADPGGVALAQDEVAGEDRPLAGEVEAEVPARVAGVQTAIRSPPSVAMTSPSDRSWPLPGPRTRAPVMRASSPAPAAWSSWAWVSRMVAWRASASASASTCRCASRDGPGSITAAVRSPTT
jgi:hypothetical protein